MVNDELMVKTLVQIERHPETWDQSMWVNECGTAFCFAGWAVKLAGYQINADEEVQFDGEQLDIREAADAVLGIQGIIRRPAVSRHSIGSVDFAWSLYAGSQNLDGIYRIAADWMQIDEQVLRDKVATYA